MTQNTLMTHDPATGEPKPYPSHAEQWRAYTGRTLAWLFNPWTGQRRSAGDVWADPAGRAIVPPGEPLAATVPPEPRRLDWCNNCRHHDVRPDEPPCDGCAANPSQDYRGTALRYEMPPLPLVAVPARNACAGCRHNPPLGSARPTVCGDCCHLPGAAARGVVRNAWEPAKSAPAS